MKQNLIMCSMLSSLAEILYIMGIRTYGHKLRCIYMLPHFSIVIPAHHIMHIHIVLLDRCMCMRKYCTIVMIVTKYPRSEKMNSNFEKAAKCLNILV